MNICCRWLSSALGTALLVCLLLTPAPLRATINDPKTIHIGVLATEGKDLCFDRWRATAEFVQQYNPQYTASIVCLDFNEVEKAVQDGLVDFTITNPAVYVNLEYIYSASRIATLKDMGDQNSATQFGSVIFTKAGRNDIQALADLKGKRVAAVAPNSFGGWMIGWRLLKQSGIDPFKDFASLNFTGQQNLVVTEVLQGKADAGVVRTGILERMIDERQIDPASFTVLHQQKEDDDTFPYIRSTELYPHYALAKMYHVSNELAEQMMLTFFDIGPTSSVARAARIQGWTIPLDYYPVHLCLQELKAGPYRYLNATPPPLTLAHFYRQYRPWILSGAAAILIILGAMIHVFLLNRKLSLTTLKLSNESKAREKILTDLNEFKTTLDNVRDSVFMFDPQTLRFLYVNQGGLDQVGYSMEEMRQFTPLAIKPDFTEDQFRKLLAPLSQSDTDSVVFITRHQRKDGSFIPVEVFVQYITPEGKKGRYVAIVRDITRRLAERREREQLQTRLNSEQKLASIGQLAAGIAHEINTPAQYLGSNIDFLDDAFTDIRGLIVQFDDLVRSAGSPEALVARMEQLKSQADWDYLSEEIPRAISQSKEGVVKISSIVLAMKEFSHPGSKEKQVTDLNKLIETTITVTSNEWKYVAEIERQLDPNLPSFSCLPNEMGQVILNMLVNAVHAIEQKIGKNREQGGKGTITLATRQVEQQIEISIADTGSGIPAAIGAKIFDPFFTTKEVGRGTGQGLAICHDIIVNKHGGKIDFTSTEGEGATFIIRLPLAERSKA